jgi:hypothetical protein
MTIQKLWTDFKVMIDAGVAFTYDQIGDYYVLHTSSGGVDYQTKVRGADVAEFEATYKVKARTVIPSVSSALPDPDGFKFRGERCFNQLITDTTTTMDFEITEERYLTGFMYSAKNSNFGDYITFSVVHPTAGVVETFVPSWGISDGSHLVDVYKAKVIAGLKLRCIYNKVGSNNVEFFANGFLHKRG